MLQLGCVKMGCTLLKSIMTSVPEEAEESSPTEDEATCDGMDSDLIFDILLSERMNVQSLQKNFEFLTFSTYFEPDSLLVLEIPENFLSKLRRGERLYIRGSPSENAHLCSNESSFSVVGAQLSSTLLVVEKPQIQKDFSTLNLPAEQEMSTIIANPSSFLQLTLPGVNCVRRVRQFLENYTFRGKDRESQLPLGAAQMTMDTLYGEIPCSNYEINVALERLFSCEINGSIRLLDFGYLEKLTTNIVRYIEEISCSWRTICQQTVMTELSTLEPLPVLQRWFQLFTTPSEIEPNLRSFDERKFCRLYAEMLLRRAGKFNLEDFEKIWQESVPDGMCTSLEHLVGLAIVHDDESPAFIEYFPHFDLPDEAAERLKALFSRKEQWSFAELKPYLRDLVAENSQLYELLEKQCRSFVENGSTFYTRKF
ncbi:hypothetical protein D918_05318 [Trichuris suis]|nr:hypothetical protein D918_05318 [Trichuris suis]